MKKFILLLFAITISVTSCSGDDSDVVTTKDYYFQINLLGDTYSETQFLGLYEDELSFCADESIEVSASLIADMEHSEFDIVVFLGHLSNLEDFEAINNYNSAIDSRESIYDSCFNNLDLDVSLWLFENNEEWLDFKMSPNNFSNIKSVTKQNGDDLTQTFAIEGSFESTFIKSDGTEVKLTGNYLVPITVLK